MNYFIELKKELAIEEYLELMKEDKSLSIACARLGQYIKELEEEIDNCDYIINKQDRDMISMSKGNHRLKDKIDKAIRYLKAFKLNDEEFNTNELLEILKGEE